MDISTELRGYLVSEFRVVADGISAIDIDHETISRAIYLYSAVFGAVARVLNISYSPELCLLHFVTAGSHGMINQRVSEVLAGQNLAVGLPVGLFPRLAEVVGQLATAVERDESYTELLQLIAALANSTTGNGFYLYQTHGVGL